MRTIAGAIVVHAGAIMFSVGVTLNGAQWYTIVDSPRIMVGAGIVVALGGLGLLVWGLVTERPKIV